MAEIPEEKEREAAPEQTEPEENPAEEKPAEEAPAEEAPAEESTAETITESEASAEDVPAEPEDADTEDAAQDKAAQDAETKKFLGDLLDLVESVIASIFVVMLFFTFLFCIANVEGASMQPTLQGGDRLLVSRLTKTYENGDILIVNNEAGYTLDAEGNIVKGEGLVGKDGSKNIVKRLIAQAGQEVNINIEEGAVYVDGVKLDEPYTSSPTKMGSLVFHYPLTIPEGYVFVLGDNRIVSTDSRFAQVGLVPVEDIVGKVVLRISPFSKFGKVQ
ncbi:MAG: signal peptidase I [Oscillospiraceae bacterium]|nr:signal peptidase I [Oscillospiraceae bacterium]